MPNIATLETLTRLGFAARGLLYILIGWIALRTGTSADSQAALDWLQSAAGGWLVGLMALGFAAYGVWRLIEAIVDTENHGTEGKGIVMRLGGAFSGLVHLALAGYAARLAWGGDGGTSGEAAADNHAATALDLPGGPTLILIAAIIVAVTGLYQFVKAYKLGFLKHLEAGAASRPWVGLVGRAGYAARGVTFLIIAWSLVRVWQSENAAAAGGLASALEALPKTAFVAVAVGLALFGVFSLVEARYRRITDPHVISRLKRAVA